MHDGPAAGGAGAVETRAAGLVRRGGERPSEGGVGQIPGEGASRGMDAGPRGGCSAWWLVMVAVRVLDSVPSVGGATGSKQDSFHSLV